MKIIICGAGQVGSSIARELAAEGNAVTVLDLSADLIRQTTDELDVQGIVGHGSHPDVLERAGARDSDMIIAVTHSDEVNMVACQIGHSLFSIPTKIARVRAQNYLAPAWQELFSREQLAIDATISPEIEVARSVLRRIRAPGSFEVIDFADGAIQVVGVSCGPDCPVVDTPLRQLTELFPDLKAVVVGIMRKERFFVPDSTDTMAVGDEAYFVAARENVQRTLEYFGYKLRETRRVIVIGAGQIGLDVTTKLERLPGMKIRMIERDKARAEAAADTLKRTIVLHGDGVDQQVLAEAGVAEAEAVVALTNDDDTNVLSAVLARHAGAQRTLALINKPAYGPLSRSLGIDAYIDPRATTVSTILQHVRRGRIKGLYSIAEGSAEVIEAEALDTSPLVGKSLRDAPIPEGMIVGAIRRKDMVIYPRGDTVIEAMDHVVLLALRDVVRKVEQLFRVSVDFF
jgi:trk system potassium uptake protein TrkA